MKGPKPCLQSSEVIWGQCGALPAQWWACISSVCTIDIFVSLQDCPALCVQSVPNQNFFIHPRHPLDLVPVYVTSQPSVGVGFCGLKQFWEHVNIPNYVFSNLTFRDFFFFFYFLTAFPCLRTSLLVMIFNTFSSQITSFSDIMFPHR